MSGSGRCSQVGDAAKTGLADASIDLASLCLVMHELPGHATDAILQEASRVLRPGGHLAIFEMDPDSPGFARIRSNPWVFAALRSTEPCAKRRRSRLSIHISNRRGEAGGLA